MMRLLRALFRRKRLEQELDAEVRFHFQALIQDYVTAGMSPREARRRARLEFGGPAQIEEECRDVRPLRRLEILQTDLRYALRSLRSNPIFATTAVLSIAL